MPPRFIEVDGENHWWDDVFLDPQRANIIADYVDSYPGVEQSIQDFTLTVMWPKESGAMGRWRILDTIVPGR